LAQALQAYEQAAEQGDPLAMYMLARAYWCAEGCSHDAEQALQAYTRAAELGDAGAQFCLGYMYANGQGVAQDYALAARWYLAAAGAPADPVSAPVAHPLTTPQTQEPGLTADVQG
jgi:TPR repeat protein